MGHAETPRIRCRFSVTITRLIPLLLSFIVLAGCESPPELITTEAIEEMLSVSYPDNIKVIGGQTGPNAGSLLLITSDDPLALPESETKQQRSSSRKRSAGVAFPVSALSNLMAANGVTLEDLPKFTDDRGQSHSGLVGDYQFNYREAATENGWLTAVEIYKIENLDKPAK